MASFKKRSFDIDIGVVEGSEDPANIEGHRGQELQKEAVRVGHWRTVRPARAQRLDRFHQFNPGLDRLRRWPGDILDACLADKNRLVHGISRAGCWR